MSENKGEPKMGALAEYLKTEAEQLKAEKVKRRAEVKEWVDSLNTLLDRFEEWLTACDPENLIDRTRETVPGQDPSLGEHSVPTLKLRIGNRSVQFVPAARYMLATVRPPGQEKPLRAQGVVELRSLGLPKYSLFRHAGQWYIQSREENLRVGGNDVLPLDADRFEAAVRDSLA